MQVGGIVLQVQFIQDYVSPDCYSQSLIIWGLKHRSYGYPSTTLHCIETANVSNKSCDKEHASHRVALARPFGPFGVHAVPAKSLSSHVGATSTIKL